MSTKKKLLMTTCCILAVLAIVTVGVFALLTVSFSISTNMGFTALGGNSKIKATVRLSGTNAGNTIAISNNTLIFDEYSSTSQAFAERNDNFVGEGVANALIYTFEITNNQSTGNIRMGVSSNLAFTNKIQTIYELEIAGQTFLGPNTTVGAGYNLIYPNESMVFRVKYILTDDSESVVDFMNELSFTLEGTNDTRTDPSGNLEIEEHGLTTTSNITSYYYDDEVYRLQSEIERFVVKDSTTQEVISNFDYSTMGDLYSPGDCIIKVFSRDDDTKYFTYHLTIKSYFNSIMVNYNTYNNPNYQTKTQYFDVQNYNGSFPISASFDSSKYKCFAFISDTGVDVDASNWVDKVELTSDAVVFYSYEKKLVTDQGFRVEFGLVENNSSYSIYSDDLTTSRCFKTTDVNIIPDDCTLSSITLTYVNLSGQIQTQIYNYAMTGISETSVEYGNSFSYIFSDWVDNIYKDPSFVGVAVSNDQSAHNRIIKFNSSSAWILNMTVQAKSGYTCELKMQDANCDFTNKNTCEKYNVEVYVRNSNGVVFDSYSIQFTGCIPNLFGSSYIAYNDYCEYRMTSSEITSLKQDVYSKGFAIGSGTGSLVNFALFNEQNTATTTFANLVEAEYYTARYSITYNSLSYLLNHKFVIIGQSYSTDFNGLMFSYDYEDERGNQQIGQMPLTSNSQFSTGSFNITHCGNAGLLQLCNTLTPVTSNDLNIGVPNPAHLSAGTYSVTLTPWRDDYIIITVTGDQSVYKSYVKITIVDTKKYSSADLSWNQLYFRPIVYNQSRGLYEIQGSFYANTEGQTYFTFMGNPTVTINQGSDIADILKYINDVGDEEALSIVPISEINTSREVIFTVTSNDETVSKTYSMNFIPGAQDSISLGNTTTNQSQTLLNIDYRYTKIYNVSYMDISDSVGEVAFDPQNNTISVVVNNLCDFENLTFNNVDYTFGNVLSIPVTSMTSDYIKASIRGCGKTLGGKFGNYQPVVINLTLYITPNIQKIISLGSGVKNIDLYQAVISGKKELLTQCDIEFYSEYYDEEQFEGMIPSSLNLDTSYLINQYMINCNYYNANVTTVGEGDDAMQMFNLQINVLPENAILYDYIEMMMLGDDASPKTYMNGSSYIPVQLISMPAMDMAEQGTDSYMCSAIGMFVKDDINKIVDMYLMLISYIV